MPRDLKPTRRGVPSGQDDVSEEAKTRIFDSGERRAGAAPGADASGSQPIRVISMKTPADGSAPAVEKREREMPHVQLRAMSEMARAQQQQNFGNFAPPYDPSAARHRSVRDYVVWGSLGVMLAVVIALVIWFVGT